jgi:glucose-6-phosphate dehydrogenase assembly protein OpcA
VAQELTRLDEWSGEDATVAEIEDALARLREASDLRTSVMTHTAWVPEEWLDAARATLAGLAERHPSRTIILVPLPEEEDSLGARASLECFRLPGEDRNVCSEVIELYLRGSRAAAPASIILPLLLPDLPVFLRWRGEPPFGSDVFSRLVDVVDRLVVDSLEWRGNVAGIADYFDRTAVSDIAWARTLPWRVALAGLWPGVAEARELRITGPSSEAALLAGWLRTRLGRHVELVHATAASLEEVEVDGELVPAPAGEPRSPSDLLSDELDRFSRDPIYEAAVHAARSDAG